MDTLIKLPLEIQISLVAGYLAYRVYVTGRGAIHKTEDVILQVIVLGLLGRVLAGALKVAASAVAGPRLVFSNEADVALITVATVVCSIAVAAYWRKYGNQQFSYLMKGLKIYDDDHEYTAWASILATKAKWTFVQVHLADKRILESYFSALPAKPIGGDITINDDGIALYVTKIYPSDPKETPLDSDVLGNENDMVITYVPKALITQIEIGRSC